MKSDSTFRVTLFPFLAVLFCTVGVLMLLIVATALTTISSGDGPAREFDAAAPAEVAVEGETPDGDSVEKPSFIAPPLFVECSAAGLAERAADSRTVIEFPLAGEMGLRAFSDHLGETISWYRSFGVAELPLIEHPFSDWLRERFERRQSHVVVFLVRPDGFEAFELAHNALQLFNEFERNANRPSVRLGYDAIPAHATIRIHGTGTAAQFSLITP